MRLPQLSGKTLGVLMRSIAVQVLLVVSAFAAPLFGACSCPPEAQSQHFLVASAPGTPGGFVACGYEDGRAEGTVRGSEFEVFRCDNRLRVLQFDALESADLNAAGANLHVVRVSNWPFGKHWSWMFVPVAETMLDPDLAKTIWQPRLPKPELTDAEVQRFLRKYAATVKRLGRTYAPDENIVAKLFAATAFGSTAAKQLFQSMRRDVNLDGAAAEVYEIALADITVGRPPNSALHRTSSRALLSPKCATISRAARSR